MARIDERTLNAFKEGHIKSFERIYRLYNGLVYNFIYNMVRDSSVSKDLTQDLFVLIWDKRVNIESTNNFEGYLFTIAKNAVYQYIRRELLLQNYINQKEKNTGIEATGADEQLDFMLLEQNILKLIKELPEARRNIFLLYWKSDMSYREIAKELSISEKTVATQVRRSLQFLRNRVDGK